jgi:hypothetical protein
MAVAMRALAFEVIGTLVAWRAGIAQAFPCSRRSRLS